MCDNQSAIEDTRKLVRECALCKKMRVFQRSHFMPKAGYKNIRSFFLDADTKMGVIFGGDIESFQATDRQVTAYALCKACEDLFSKHGEQHVANFGYRLDKSRLDSSLSKTGLTHLLNPLTLGLDSKAKVTTNLVGQVSPEKYHYFALSIVWRAVAIDWQPHPAPYRDLLDESLEDELRMFPLGEIGYRPAVTVHVGSITDFEKGSRMVFPQCTLDGGQFHFVVFGTRFKVTLSHFPLFNGTRGHVVFYRTSFQGSELGKAAELL